MHQFSISIDESPFAFNLECSNELNMQGLCIHTILCGLIDGAFETFSAQVLSSVTKCPCDGKSNTVELHVKFECFSNDEHPPADF